jgi:hypothetical protein
VVIHHRGVDPGQVEHPRAIDATLDRQGHDARWKRGNDRQDSSFGHRWPPGLERSGSNAGGGAVKRTPRWGPGTRPRAPFRYAARIFIAPPAVFFRAARSSSQMVSGLAM